MEHKPTYYPINLMSITKLEHISKFASTSFDMGSNRIKTHLLEARPRKHKMNFRILVSIFSIKIFSNSSQKYVSTHYLHSHNSSLITHDTWYSEWLSLY